VGVEGEGEDALEFSAFSRNGVHIYMGAPGRSRYGVVRAVIKVRGERLARGEGWGPGVGKGGMFDLFILMERFRA
jgi:hypothetical protein